MYIYLYYNAYSDPLVNLVLVSLPAIYITVMEVIAASNLILSILIQHLHSHHPHHPIPTWIPPAWLKGKNKIQEKTPMDAAPTHDIVENPWHVLSRKCDHTLFIVLMLLVALITVVLIILLLV